MTRQAPTGYVAAAPHPWAVALFVVPLLAVYEVGVVRLADGGVPARNGAEEWARAGLAGYGVPYAWGLPAAIAAGLIAWAWVRRADRPPSPVKALVGMALESVALAVLLWLLAKNFGPMLDRLAPAKLAIAVRPTAAREVVTYLGAGLYEEILFRLGLFGGLVFVLRRGGVASLPAVLVAAAGAAAVFAYAHHLGPAGEPWHPGKFVFRAAAGLYFTAAYIARGLGVAAGTHAAYNVLVGVAVG